MATLEIAMTNPRRNIILLVAPVHDAFTVYTAGLLEKAPELGAPKLLCKPESPLAYDELLTELAIDPSETEVGLVFCGHGRKDSLLGPGPPGDKSAFSTFFDQKHIMTGPKCVLAFCSNAATGLGDAYERHSHDRTFVGFQDQIGLVMGEGVYAASWRRILFGSASAMLNAADTRTLEKSVLGLYRDVLSHFSPKRDRKYRYGFLMRAYLRHQMTSIRFIRT